MLSLKRAGVEKSQEVFDMRGLRLAVAAAAAVVAIMVIIVWSPWSNSIKEITSLPSGASTILVIGATIDQKRVNLIIDPDTGKISRWNLPSIEVPNTSGSPVVGDVTWSRGTHELLLGFTRAGQDNVIYAVDREGNSTNIPIKIPSEADYGPRPVLYPELLVASPNGQEIIVPLLNPDPAHRRKASEHLIAISRSGIAHEILTGTESKHSPTFSPDGSQLVFTGIVLENDRWSESIVYRLPASGGVPTEIARVGITQKLIWAPKGNRIGMIGAGPSGEWGVWTIADDGSAMQLVVPKKKDPMSFDWSPDAKRIAYLSSREGPCHNQYFSNIVCDFSLYIVNADGLDERRIAGPFSGIGDVHWLE